MPAQIEEKFLEMSHGKTRILEAGSGDPTILVHGAGFLSSADSWLPVIGPLSQRLRVISMDALNFGKGDVFNQELSFGYMVDHIREVLDVLGIEKANFIGHSMGGWLGTVYGYESPHRINKLILVAPGGARPRPLASMVDWQPPSEENIREQVGRNLPADQREKVVQGFLDKRNNPEQVEAFANVMRHMTNNMTRERYNTIRRLPGISVPTLIMWGTADTTNDLSMGVDMINGIPNAKMIVYNGVGHGVPQQIPEQFVRDVLAFLAPD